MTSPMELALPGEGVRRQGPGLMRTEKGGDNNWCLVTHVFCILHSQPVFGRLIFSLTDVYIFPGGVLNH